MSPSPSILRVAGEREAGVACPHCHGTVMSGTAVSVCPLCATVHHESCWQTTEHCGSYACAPARREPAHYQGTALKISASELEQVQPLPVVRLAAQAVLPSPPAQPRTNRLAIAAFICALAGIPLFGVLTGLVAIVLGSLAIGSLQHTRQRGTVLALLGILLGLADVIGWIVFLSLVLSRPGVTLSMDSFRPDESAMNNLDPSIDRAMRANVFLERSDGWGGKGIGSGVILHKAAGQALILTNRHVVDAKFAPASPEKENDLSQIALDVKMIDQSVQPGKVTWVAPGGIDLALVRVACLTDEAQAAKWRLGRRLLVGAPVFAIGNPHGLGWTHTQGTISQFRLQDVGARSLRIIQTHTVINPGNSGGGLYDAEGYLIGVNTWTQDRRQGEGLNFAIALDILAQVPPPGLELHTQPKERENP